MAGVNDASAARAGGLAATRDFLSMIKVSHSVFALPFAVAAAVLAGGARREHLFDWLWIVLAVVAARTAAMSFNRIVDRELDAENPRTRARHLPAGVLTVRFAVLATLVAAAVFLLSAGMLGRLPLRLAPFVLAWLLAYSYAKRFTALSHLWLGTALGLAPIGAWIAITGNLLDAWRVPCLLGLSVTLWTAGFDVIYACQDEAFDRERGLRSIPARMGVAGALWVARLLHVLLLVTLLALPRFAPSLGWIYGIGLAAVTALLAWEHSLVRAGDLSRVNLAFFVVNGVISMLLGAALVMDHLH